MLDNLGLHDSKDIKMTSRTQRAFVSSNVSCYHCKDSHAIYVCPKFLALSVSDRISRTKGLKLCLSCFRNSHTAEKCNTRWGGCRKCKGNDHNTLLHTERSTSEPKIEASNKEQPAPSATFSSQIAMSAGNVLLATALVLIQDKFGEFQKCRALLDSASQSNFITRRLAKRLGLVESSVDISIQGINQVVSTIKTQCAVNMRSRVTDFNATFNCLVLNKISEDMPSTVLDACLFEIPENLELADPNFDVTEAIDLLIGAQIFWSLLSQGQIKLGRNMPVLQNSQLGWMLSGPLQSTVGKSSKCFFTQDVASQFQLQKFWELEEVPSVRSLSQQQQEAEDHFLTNFKRDDSGRCVVSIPFRTSVDQLGESHDIAMRRFNSLEKKLDADSVLREAYSKFMAEYELLGHMSKLEAPDNSGPHFYLPHHGVVNENSKTTKLRVVFDGSCATSSGVSINDLQLVGPTVQDLLFNILVRFRFHSVAFSADVQKMYRQVLVSPEHRRFQQILWRPNKSLPISTYQLNTITYGTASAPFLATRCLVHVADINKERFPEACKIIRSDFYVDDLLSGTDTTQEGTEICQQISKILNSIKFPLHKWISNKPEVLPGANRLSSNTDNVCIGKGDMTKTLGLHWSPSRDSLNYKIAPSQLQEDMPITKRVLLSEISQIFDPLGLLSPATIIGKMILQELWQLGTDWDENIPKSVSGKWYKFRSELSQLNYTEIPRHVTCESPVHIEIHCFSDASEMAYASCIYIRSTNIEGTISVNLLCAKAKVAPLKRITIPRLELCGAHLSAKLMTVLTNTLRGRIDGVFMWSDSTIVLGWLNTSPNALKVFVSHRVADIQTKCKLATWAHVPTRQNPADLASRGVIPSVLNESRLWWYGPDWLSRERSCWPNNTPDISVDSLPEIKRVERTFMSGNVEFPIQISQFSTYSKLIRTTAYCFRFIGNCRLKSPARVVGPLNPEELGRAEMSLVRMVQLESWNHEIRCLKSGKSLPNNSKLLSLSPFLDDLGFLRVGGRLQESMLPVDQKHPLLLPKHDFTVLLFNHEHRRLSHAGPQQLLFSIREKFWPLNGRNYARLTNHRCVRCFRCKPVNHSPLMGNLPAERVTPALPFQIVGVDFAGPFSIKDRQGRGCKVTKCYVALFVCFVVKAVHIELVSSLSTEAFLASLRRFVARRGKPTKIYSDNGGNFVGASNELNHLINQLRSDSGEIAETLASEGISWSFIPPHSPNFGGLWEAGVKSFKYHFKRVAGNALLTFEQFYTLITQVESVLNSRPLSPMSSSPNDFDPISPAHFLIGRMLTSLPEQILLEIPPNRLSVYNRIQQMTQVLWVKWKKEYLHNLQQRKKCAQSGANLTVGTMVLLQDDNAPPLSWPVGRVVDIFKGRDNQIRVVNVRTARGVYKRASSKVFPLPIYDNNGDGAVCN